MDHAIYLKLKREWLLHKAEQIHKMTTIFTQIDNFVDSGQFWVLFLDLLSFTQQLFSSQLCDPGAK